MPFLAEKITGMLFQILKMVGPAEMLEAEGETLSKEELREKLAQEASGTNEKLARKARLKQKIFALGKMKAMLGSLRENSEVILKMKQVSLDGKLPRGILLENRSGMKFDEKTFNMTKDLDAQNEKRPTKKGEKAPKKWVYYFQIQ